MSTFTPTLWMEARRRTAQTREHQRRQLLEQLKTLLQRLTKKYSWQELYLFGSLFTPGKFTETSDSDFDQQLTEIKKIYALLRKIFKAKEPLLHEITLFRKDLEHLAKPNTET